MKKVDRSIKKRIKSRIILQQKPNKMNERQKRRISGTVPLKVELATRHERRIGEKKWFPVPTERYPVSIIVTAYKSQDFIEECLDSIENQTYFVDNDKFEVIVGVDGCQETLEKLLELRPKYRNLRIFMMDENCGTYVTSNTIINKIKYDNIIRFDSDDIMMPQMVNEIMYYHGKYNVIRLRYVKMFTDKKVPFAVYAHGVLYMTRDFFKQLGGYRSWRCAADTELLKRGTNIINEKQIETPLFYRRMHGNSLTGSGDYGANSELRIKYRKIIRSENFDLVNIKIRKKMSKYVEY